MAFTSKCKTNLPIYGIKNKELKDFATTEKDLDKGISRIPLVLARIYEEDLLKDDDDDSVMVMTEPMEILDNYTHNMEHRSRAYSHHRTNSAVEEGDSIYQEARSSILFSKSMADCCIFEDFKIVHIIGKGTFGKVRA